MSEDIYRKKRAQLITSRRAIMAGFGAIVASPAYPRDYLPKLERLSDVPLTVNPADYSDFMRDGLFLPDYRFPQCRMLFNDGTSTGWFQYRTEKKSSRYAWDRMQAIEVCAPDSNGAPRFAQLKIR